MWESFPKLTSLITPFHVIRRTEGGHNIKNTCNQCSKISQGMLKRWWFNFVVIFMAAVCSFVAYNCLGVDTINGCVEFHFDDMNWHCWPIANCLDTAGLINCLQVPFTIGLILWKLISFRIWSKPWAHEDPKKLLQLFCLPCICTRGTQF